jgi:hypothetical protein
VTLLVLLAVVALLIAFALVIRVAILRWIFSSPGESAGLGLRISVVVACAAMVAGLIYLKHRTREVVQAILPLVASSDPGSPERAALPDGGRRAREDAEVKRAEREMQEAKIDGLRFLLESTEDDATRRAIAKQLQEEQAKLAALQPPAVDGGP